MWFLVGVLIGGLPMLALADTYQPSQWYYVSSPGFSGATPENSCERFASAFGHSMWRVTAGGSHGLCESGFTTYNNQNWIQYPATVCPYGGTLSGGVCVNAPACETGIRDPQTGQCFECPEGRIWNGTTCESPCEAKAGNSYGTANSWAVLDADRVPSGAPTFCADACQVTGGKVECESVSAGGTTSDYVSLGVSCAVQGPFTYTGQGCGPVGSMPLLVGVDDTQKPWWSLGDDMKDCSARGGYWGQVGGLDTCLRPQPGETFDKETSTGNETTGTSETAADGTTTEKTTSTTTECKDGKCTTTTTTTTVIKDSTGQQVGDATSQTKTETKPEADFCKANPQHAQCAGTKTGGSFSGGCTTGFACTGDAVQCAIAQAAHNQSCAMAVGDGVLGQFEQITGFDGTAPGEGLDRKEIEVPDALQVAEIGGGTGLQDQTFVIMGRSIDIPFSVLNQYIEMLGYAIMLIAWIGAWRIIAGAF